MTMEQSRMPGPDPRRRLPRVHDDGADLEVFIARDEEALDEPVREALHDEESIRLELQVKPIFSDQET